MNFFVAICPSTYVRTPSGSCLDIKSDFNNCGTVEYVCPSDYKSCVDGQCTAVPIVQLMRPMTIVSGIDSLNFDDTQYDVDLPFNVTLYNATRNRVIVTTNGVSFLLIKMIINPSSIVNIRTNPPPGIKGPEPSIMAERICFFLGPSIWGGPTI